QCDEMITAIKEIARFPNAAATSQNLRFMTEMRLVIPLAAFTCGLLDGLRQIVCVEDDVFETELFEPKKGKAENRNVEETNGGFCNPPGDGPEPFAQPCAEDQPAHRISKFFSNNPSPLITFKSSAYFG